MLAVFILPALLGLALGDPLPPVQKRTEIINIPAPKPQVVKVPALQEHARVHVQHVPFKQTIVKTINVPKDIIREVPVYVEKKLILKQPHIRKFPIDVKKTLLQPHITHVPQVRVNYRKRPYDVWHTKKVNKYIEVPRPVPVIKHKIITKVLNRIVDVPHKVYKDKVKVVQVPQPFKVQKVHHRKIDVPIEVRVPVPRVHIKRTQEVQNVPIDVTVVKKVAIPKRTTLTEIVPVPVKPEGCGPDGVNCGSLASVNSVTGRGVGLASVIQRQDVVVDGAPGGVVSDTIFGGRGSGQLVNEDIGPIGPDFGPGIGPAVGPRRGPEFGPGIGPEFGPGIGPEFGPGIGPEVGPGIGLGIDSESYYSNGPRFGGGPDDASFFESSIAGGSSIGLTDLATSAGDDFGFVERAGVGGPRSDLVSIRHSERVVPFPISSGIGGPFRGGYEGGSYRDGYVDGPNPDDYFDRPGYLDGELGSGRLVRGGGSGFAVRSGFDNGLSGLSIDDNSGLSGALGGRFETVGGGNAGGVFYQETRNALPLQVTGTVRGEYAPREAVTKRVMMSTNMDIRKDRKSLPSRLSAFPTGL